MSRCRHVPPLLLWLALLAAAPARAADPEAPPRIPFWLTLQGGGMFPSGEEGSGLRRGAQGSGSVAWELSRNFVLSGDLAVFSSGDAFRTRLVMAGLSGRLLPHPDLPTLYVQGGAGLYDIAYRPLGADVVPPPAKIRPGLSFGVGFDAFERPPFTLGVLGSYHGVVIARSDALAFLTLGVYASIRPASW